MSARSLLRASAGICVPAVLALLVLLAAFPASASAVEPPLLDEDRIALEQPTAPRIEIPSDADDPEPTAAPSTTPRATPSPSPSIEPEPAPPEHGYDISYPQCGGPFPDASGFAIVGVNGGRVYSANPCLGTGDGPSQLAWAGPDVELYVNTGNPGPVLSRYWPIGADGPRACADDDRDSLDCSYQYGWNAAQYAHAVALDAFVDLGWADPDATRLPGEITWWLDVEDANSWRGDPALNVAALEGMVHALESLGAAEVGFYSTPRLWNRITGGTDAFSAYPAWHAGARDEADARDRCEGDAFTGGELRMVQWVEGGFDANVRCAGTDARDR